MKFWVSMTSFSHHTILSISLFLQCTTRDAMDPSIMAPNVKTQKKAKVTAVVKATVEAVAAVATMMVAAAAATSKAVAVPPAPIVKS